MKRYDETLRERVAQLKEGLGRQVLSALLLADPGLAEDKREKGALYRILAGSTFPGDVARIKKMEKAKSKLLRLRK